MLMTNNTMDIGNGGNINRWIEPFKIAHKHIHDVD
jgi:hypothetical protein